jgi:thiol:disulfide interchange protein
VKNLAKKITRRAKGEAMGKIVISVFIVVLSVWGVQRWQHKARHSMVSYSNSSDAVQFKEFSELFDNNIALANLAAPGKFTVVEVYLDQCAYCRDFEAGFSKFQGTHNDIIFVRVHHPGHMHFKIAGNTPEEQQKFANDLNAKIKSYEFCGTPHIEVYGPDQQPVAQDRCGKRAGTRHMWEWMGKEAGIAPKLNIDGVTRM